MFTRHKATECVKLILVISMLGLELFTSAPSEAGGLLLYEFGTADVGLASAGYNVRAQDASTVFTNPAGMTRLEGTQVLAAGQVLWSNAKFSIGSGTSPALGEDDGGYVTGSDGWFPGGRGNLIGSYDSIGTIFLGLYANWKF